MCAQKWEIQPHIYQSKSMNCSVRHQQSSIRQTFNQYPLQANKKLWKSDLSHQRKGNVKGRLSPFKRFDIRL